VANYSRLRIALFKPLLALFSRMPESLLLSQVRRQFQRLLKNDPHRDFWLSYFEEAEIANLGEHGLANKYACMRDLISNYSVSPEKISKWPGKVLILETDDETGFTQGERKALRALYRNARVRVFTGAGHLSFLTRPQEFARIVLDFLLPAGAQGDSAIVSSRVV
jgi:pimeloyl-ACP methyl ester carboxylesterase